MGNESQIIPIKDRISVENNEREGVLAGLVDLTGHRLQPGKYAVEQLLSGEKRNAFLVGEPGIGKTSILLQLAAAVMRNTQYTNLDYDLLIHLYDNFLGRRNDDTHPFNIEVHNAILKERGKFPRIPVVNLMEFPAVGRTDHKDRGVTILELEAQRSNMNGNDTLFIFIVRNRALQIKSAYLRGEVQDMRARPNDLIKYLKDHNVIFEGIPEIEGVRRISDFFEKMARKEHIEAIRREENELIHEWRIDNEDDYKLRKRRMRFDIDLEKDIRDVLHEFGADGFTEVKEQVAKAAENYTLEVVDQAAYVSYRFDQLGIPQSSRLIVFNPKVPGDITVDYSLLERPIS